MLALCLESPEHSTPLYGQRASTSRRAPSVLAASGRFIFPIIWPNWQVVHRRVATGGTLNAAGQAVYESGCQALDAEERLDGNLERLRELRAQHVSKSRRRTGLREFLRPRRAVPDPGVAQGRRGHAVRAAEQNGRAADRIIGQAVACSDRRAALGMLLYPVGVLRETRPSKQ